MSCCIKGVALRRQLGISQHSLSASSSGLWPLGKKRKESLQLCLRSLNCASNSPIAPHWPSCQISANQHKVETSANAHSDRKNMRKITNVIFANQHFASTRCRYSNSRNIVAGSPSFSLPIVKRPRELARRLFSIPLLVSLPNDIWGTLAQIFHTDDISLPRTWALLG